VIFDDLGVIVRELNSTIDSSPDPLDVPVGVVVIVRDDLSVKTYVTPRFAVYF
jgi:hypothetical protein